MMEGFILAGGKSSRMGTDKGKLIIGGRSMIDRAGDALASVAVGGISVVGGSEDLNSNYAWVPDPDLSSDDTDRSGPLLGLYAALSNSRSEWIAVLACDLPFVNGELMKTLAGIDRAGFDAVVPIQKDGIEQPLCALYRREPCLAAAKALLTGSDRSMRSLLASIKTRSIPFDAIRGLKNAKHFFLNVNRPDDYAAALQASRKMHPDDVSL